MRFISLMGLSALVATSSLAGCTGTGAPGALNKSPVTIAIKPGQFMAGSSKAETDAFHYPDALASREQPARMVTISKRYAMGKTEVTRGDFAKFVKATGWKPDGPCGYLADGPTNTWGSDTAHGWQNPGFAQTDAHPVVCVNLADAQAYAAWLSTETGRHFRLPSNTEWEYAARAGTASARWWGDLPDSAVCAFASVSDANRARAHNGGVADPAKFFPCDDGYLQTAPAASFKPNPWGLYDMAGNVWEWTLDCLNENQDGAPTDSAARTSGDCRSHMDRGGSWTNSPKYIRSAAQHPDLIEARNTVLGFRLLEELP